MSHGPQNRPPQSRREFIALTALLMSLAAMAIDSMLPALGAIRTDFGVTDANDGQLVVSAMFIGLSVSQLFVGPLSDGIGRRPAMLIGLFVFLVGCAVSALAPTFEWLLAGRVLQGAGAAAPRAVAVASIRDRLSGDAMASVMSLIMAVFILVPTLAPFVGQGVLEFASWRAIFGVLMLQGVVAFVWMLLRQEETLPAEKRLPLSAARIGAAFVETLRSRHAMGYTVAAGLVTGAFVGYLNAAQQIFVEQYDVGRAFPVYFGSLALALGAAALMNSRMVLRFGMRRLCWWALVGIAAYSILFLGVFAAYGDNPPLVGLMLYLLPLFFFIGFLFGNFNALALEPLEHIAGTAAAVIGAAGTLLGAVLGTVIGQSLDTTFEPLVVGFALLGTVSLAVMWWTEGRTWFRAAARSLATR